MSVCKEINVYEKISDNSRIFCCTKFFVASLCFNLYDEFDVKFKLTCSLEKRNDVII